MPGGERHGAARPSPGRISAARGSGSRLPTQQPGWRRLAAAGRAGAGVLDHQRDVVGACWRCRAMNSIASCAPFAIEMPMAPDRRVAGAAAAAAPRAPDRVPKLWPCASGRPWPLAARATGGARPLPRLRQIEAAAAAGAERQQRQAPPRSARRRVTSEVCTSQRSIEMVCRPTLPHLSSIQNAGPAP